MDHQWWYWWCHWWINPLRPPSLWYSLIVGLPWIVGLRQVGNIPWVVSVYEAIGGLLRLMMYPRGDNSQFLLLPYWWWFIILVWVWCQNSDTDRERPVIPTFQCILTWFLRLRGHAGMQYWGLFDLSGWVLKAIWCTWLRSCGLSRGVRIRIDTAGGCPSVSGYLRIVLKGPWRSSCGWHIF